jgi:flagellar protein FlaG
MDMDIQSLSSNVTHNSKLESAQASASKEEFKVVTSSVDSPELKAKHESEKVSQDQLDSINPKLAELGLGMAFSVDENTKSSVIKLIDKTTDEVIQQFPSEGSLKIITNIQNYLDSVRNQEVRSKEGLTGTLLSEII